MAGRSMGHGPWVKEFVQMAETFARRKEAERNKDLVGQIELERAKAEREFELLSKYQGIGYPY